MQQNLLAERFKMTFHHEQREAPSYDLVVAKNGAKMKEAEPPPPEDPDAPKPAAAPPARKVDKDGFPILAPGRQWNAAMDGNRWTQRVTDASMGNFARYLANMVGQPVNDATGLKGKYDFILKWIGYPGRPIDDDSGPNIFEALQAQLGLKLESKKTMVDVLVIDHIEKTPTEN